MAGARDALDRYGSGLTGSRLLNGTIRLHREEELAAWLGAVIAFTTGHHANLGALSALVSAGDTIVADSADHASMVDGALLAGEVAPVPPQQHRSDARCARGSDGGGVLLVVDGVFSMEGDVAPLPEIVEAAERHGARVMVDEAHALGVLGSRGAGACRGRGQDRRPDGYVLEGVPLRVHRRNARGDGLLARQRARALPISRLPACPPPPGLRLRQCESADPPRVPRCSPASQAVPGAFGGVERSRVRSRSACDAARRYAHLHADRPRADQQRRGCCGRRCTTPACT